MMMIRYHSRVFWLTRILSLSLLLLTVTMIIAFADKSIAQSETNTEVALQNSVVGETATSIPVYSTRAVSSSESSSTITTMPALTFTDAQRNADQVSQSDILAIYQDLIEASVRAVDAARNTLNLVITIASAMTVIVLGAGAFSLTRTQKAYSQLRRYVEKADELDRTVTELRAHVTQTEKKLDTALATAEVVQKKLNAVEVDHKRLRDNISSDTKILEQMYAMYQVDLHGLDLFSGDQSRTLTAREMLLSLSRHEDPVVRRTCVGLFSELCNLQPDDWHDPAIHERLTSIVSEDDEYWVQLTADATLSCWESLRPDGSKYESLSTPATD